MKALLIAEYRNGKLLGSTEELISFAHQKGLDAALFLVGSRQAIPAFDGTLYFADAETYGEFNPEVHKALILAAAERFQPELVVFSHSSYGWDLAPRVAYGLDAAQVSEVVDFIDGVPVVPVCNGKLRREIQANTSATVLTLQAGAFGVSELNGAPPPPAIEELAVEPDGRIRHTGYEQAEAGGVDLSRSDIIVSGGRGIGKKDNISLIAELAQALGGEYGASRPVVDAQWVEHNRQVGTTGQSVAPKLYVACGISGAVQHVAGMKKAEFVVAVNTDKDAPIAEVADVHVVADLTQFIPSFTEKLKAS